MTEQWPRQEGIAQGQRQSRPLTPCVLTAPSDCDVLVRYSVITHILVPSQICSSENANEKSGTNRAGKIFNFPEAIQINLS